MLPLVARNPAIEKAVGEYALAHAGYYEATVNAGKNPPINYKDNNALDRFANLVLHEELTWSHPDKMSIVEYPFMSDDQEALRSDKYVPNSDLQYGDRRYTGKRQTFFTDDKDTPQGRSSRVVNPLDPTIEATGDYVDLYDALNNVDLTVRQREAIDLVYFDELTQEDAARVMGVKKSNVNAYLSVALRKLNEYMTK